MSAFVGQPIPRKDGVLKVTGRARYPADVAVPTLAYGAVVLSTIPAGKIELIDDRASRGVAGFIGIVSCENAPKLQELGDLPDGEYGERILPFQDRNVYFRGQYVALVVASTENGAREAAEKLKVNYAPVAFEVSMEHARDVYRPEKYNKKEPAQPKRGDFEGAKTSAEVSVEEVYLTPYMNHNPLEPHAALAKWEGDRLTIHETSQGVVGMGAVLAKLFSVPKENVEVISPFVGGGFGCKGFVWPHTVLATMAARVLQVPVKVNLRRQEMFTVVGHRGPTRQTIFLGATRDGKLTALRHATLTHTSIKGQHFESCGLATSVLYACPNAEFTHDVARVNTGSPTPMRAPGEAPGTFAIESAMDELAAKLQIDPIELRIRNHADEDPQHHKKFSSKHLLECYREGAELFGWGRRSPQPGSMREGSELVGWGMATAIYPANKRSAKAKVSVSASGEVVVRCATQDIGTGTYTTLTQIAADELGVPINVVRAEIGNSKLPPGGVSGGSSTSASVGPVVSAAAKDARAKLLKLALADRVSPLYGLAPDAIETHQGALVAKADASRKDGYKEILGRARQESVEGEGSNEVAPDATEKAPFSEYSFGAQFVEVRVHALTKQIRVARVVTVIDGGRVLNALTAQSQIQGGVVWGIGMALMEATELDERLGAVVTRNLADYLVPVNADVPDITVKFINEPDLSFNTLGVRGIGEIGITGITAAIANAVYHATGVRVRELPIRVERLLV